MKRKFISVAALAILVLAACTEGKEKQTYGALLGAGIGALVGSQFGGGNGQLAATAVGAVGGAWIGSEVGKGMDEEDKMKDQETAQASLEYNKSGETSSWQNPDTGNSGSYTPTSTYKSEGRDCREFESTITVDGETQPATGRACRVEDGTWVIVQ